MRKLFCPWCKKYIFGINCKRHEMYKDVFIHKKCGGKVFSCEELKDLILYVASLWDEMD